MTIDKGGLLASPGGGASSYANERDGLVALSEECSSEGDGPGSDGGTPHAGGYLRGRSRSFRHDNNNEPTTPTRREQHHLHHHQHHHHQLSPWLGVPMTTRPHFERHEHSSPRPIRRVRSRSLGSAVEASRLENFRSLLTPPSLPPMPGLTYDGSDDGEVEEGELSPVMVGTPTLKKSATADTSVYSSGETAASAGENLKQQKDQEKGELAGKHEGESNEKVVESGVEMAKNPAWICALYGLINATIVLPVLMSFGAIIYRDEAFSPYMPVLVKLTLVSGIVHQLCFSTLSSLPFAVGQVQDAGLIFLSSMASSMVQHCRSRGVDDESMLATVTVGLSLCTALLGLGLVLVGYFGLAQYVQMLPTCVVGGYLAFIGWFCGVSGVGIMAGSSEVTFKLASENFALVAPGVLGGIFIYASVRKLGHMAVLPTCILLLIVLFYAALLLTGSTIESVTEQGWIRKMDPAPSWYHTWDFLRFDKVVWSALPNLALTELSMIFVVALSSSLDVAAIELELGEPLNYNRELSMVGVSNMVSGMTGGYTGSYIFSQSIFSLRAGIRSRLAGYVLALTQVVVLVLPVPILAYVPNFFFGSLLSMICVDLMYEWLWDVRTRLTLVEYVICLSTFGSIQFLGVEYGILAGVVLYVACRKVGIDVGEGKIITREDLEEEEEDCCDDGDDGEHRVGQEKAIHNINAVEGGGQYGSI